MASTGLDYSGGAVPVKDAEKATAERPSSDNASIRSISRDHTHRKLKSRHIQLIGTFLAPTLDSELS
jgi:amino acid permease